MQICVRFFTSHHQMQILQFTNNLVQVVKLKDKSNTLIYMLININGQPRDIFDYYTFCC